MVEPRIVFIGRLEKDTGLLKFLEWLKSKNQKADFIGDGKLRESCEKFGTVYGFIDPKPFLKRASICVPSGYLSYIEAKQVGCKIMVFPDNPLKSDYWSEIKRIKKFPSWDQIADEYLDLYNSIK